MKVFLGLIPGDVVFGVARVLDFDPDDAFSFHEGHHKVEVKAPDEDDGEDAEQRRQQERIVHLDSEGVVTVNSHSSPFILVELKLVLVIDDP